MKQNAYLRQIFMIILIMSLVNVFMVDPSYAQKEKTVNLRIDGSSVNHDVLPYIDNQSRTIVPLRFIGEELGYSFAWDQETKQVAFTGNDALIFLTLGSKEAVVNGNKALMDTVALVKDGRTMVPLRFILENLGVKVEYDSASNAVNIMTKESESSKPALINSAVISENTVNVRSGPGTTYSVISKVSRGNSYQVLAQSGDWYQIAVDNEIAGWVAGWVVAIRGETTEASRSPELGERDPVITNPVKLVNIADVNVDVAGEDVFITISGDAKLNYTVFSLDNPKRLVVDFFSSVLENKENEDGAKEFQVKTELVQGVRMAQFSENQVRVVVDVSKPAGLNLVTNEVSKLTFKVDKPSILGKTIVIDPGHASIQPGGWSDPGAVGPTKLYERDVVLDIGLTVSKLLKDKGANVIMTRTGDTSLSLGGRADVANNNKADIFVSIHANANTSRAINGSSTYFYGNVDGQYQAREKLARSIQKELVASAKRKDIGVMQASFAVLRYTKVPSVLVETAFISNYEEEKLLADPGFRKKVAEGIVQGIENYFIY